MVPSVGLDDAGVDPDPFPCSGAGWRRRAKSTLADAMVLATATLDGRPSVRTVILRTLDETGFVFCTDTGSRKARELAANPAAAAVFVWAAVEHQVRLEGEVSALADQEADRYFSHPRGPGISGCRYGHRARTDP